MPELSEEGEHVLKAKVSWAATAGAVELAFAPRLTSPVVVQGQPYVAAGVVDLLALFRCISCRYCFSTDLAKPELLGAPGRVFTSRQVSG